MNVVLLEIPVMTCPSDTIMPVTRKKAESVLLISSLSHPVRVTYMMVGGPPALKLAPISPVRNPATTPQSL